MMIRILAQEQLGRGARFRFMIDFVNTKTDFLQ